MPDISIAVMPAQISKLYAGGNATRLGAEKSTQLTEGNLTHVTTMRFHDTTALFGLPLTPQQQRQADCGEHACGGLGNERPGCIVACTVCNLGLIYDRTGVGDSHA